MPRMYYTLAYDGRTVLRVEGEAPNETEALKIALKALIESITLAASGVPVGTIVSGPEDNQA